MTKLTPADYGLPDNDKGRKATYEINEIVNEVKSVPIAAHEKWLAVYQVLKRHKQTGAINQKALDAIESQFKSGVDELWRHEFKTKNEKSERRGNRIGNIFYSFIAGAGVLLSPVHPVLALVVCIMAAGLWFLVHVLNEEIIDHKHIPKMQEYDELIEMKRK